jgi:hypothetical protein
LRVYDHNYAILSDAVMCFCNLKTHRDPPLFNFSFVPRGTIRRFTFTLVDSGIARLPYATHAQVEISKINAPRSGLLHEPVWFVGTAQLSQTPLNLSSGEKMQY